LLTTGAASLRHREVCQRSPANPTRAGWRKARRGPPSVHRCAAVSEDDRRL